jgi:AcrR family transcriptional regulator
MEDTSGKLKDRSGVGRILATSSESRSGRGGKGSRQQWGVRSVMESAKTMQPPRRRDADKAAAILEGALQEFTAYGYAAASMDRIAAAGKVSKPTLYTYFQDKEGLFTALILDLMKDEPLFNADITAFAQPPEVFLKGLASRVLGDLSGDQPRFTLFRLLMAESGRFPELAEAFIKNVEKPILGRLEGYFAQHPELNCPDPQVAARIFMGTIAHYIMLQEVLNGKEFLPLERDRLIDGLIELITAKRSASV